MTNIAIAFSDWPDDTVKYGTINVYLSGCALNCHNCHNSSMQKYEPVNVSMLYEEVLHYMDTTPIRHIILSGGDPLYKHNRAITIELLSLLSDYPVMIYTGEDSTIFDSWHDIKCSYIKCGRYIEELKQQSGHFGNEFRLASTNQILLCGKSYKQLSVNGVYRKEA